MKALGRLPNQRDMLQGQEGSQQEGRIHGQEAERPGHEASVRVMSQDS